MATMPDSFFSWVVFLLNEYGATLLQGAGVTLLLALVGTFIGCVIGLAVGICQTIPEDPNGSSFKQALVKGLKAVLSSYVEIFRGTPMIVQAMVVYYGAMSLFDIDMSAMFAGFLVVSINTGAYMAETVRGGIESIDEGQREAAVAIGMDHFQTMRYVVLPQALRNIMPQIGNNFIINVKDTSVMFIIGFNDFFAVHKAVAGATFRFFPSAAIEMAGYLTMTLLASFLLRRLEKLLDGHASYELVREDPLVATAGTYNYPGKGSPYDEVNRERPQGARKEDAE